MARGKLHFVIGYDMKKKTACGLDRGKVNTTVYAGMVSCRRCKWTKVFWNRNK